jgi:hypothetical protein
MLSSVKLAAMVEPRDNFRPKTRPAKQFAEKKTKLREWLLTMGSGAGQNNGEKQTVQTSLRGTQ